MLWLPVTHIGRFLFSYDEFFPQSTRDVFNRDTFEWLATAKYAEHGIPENFRIDNQSLLVGAAAVQPMIINNMNVLKEHYFFKGSDGTFFSVQDEDMRREARKRNYEEFFMAHYTKLDHLPQTIVPTVITPPPTINPEIAPFRTDIYPPSVGGNIPPLYKKENTEVYAVHIVRAWEDRIIVNGQPFMPFRLWDVRDAKASGITEPLTHIAKPYIVVRRVKSNTPVAEIVEEVKVLLRIGSAYKKREGLQTDWITLARQIANENNNNN